jgi:hypothetical protein
MLQPALGVGPPPVPVDEVVVDDDAEPVVAPVVVDPPGPLAVEVDVLPPVPVAPSEHPAPRNSAVVVTVDATAKRGAIRVRGNVDMRRDYTTSVGASARRLARVIVRSSVCSK